MPDPDAPVSSPPPYQESDARPPEPGMGLCLSGGGYRAMLFHLGTLWRLNELAWLPRLKRVSSVSGGSITAALLGLRWSGLAWRNGIAADLEQQVIDPIRALASRTIDVGSILGGALLPGRSVSDQVQKAYRKHLYGEATLQGLVAEGQEAPRFVVNATNVQTGTLWRFSRPYMADWRVGQVDQPDTSLALAVAASSAFPPVLSPCRMKLRADLVRATPGADLHREPYTTSVVLTDGGVYDNLGLETVWKRYDTILVSDGGGQMSPEDNPSGNWACHGLRINSLIDNQVRALRKRQVVGSFVRGERKGSYWSMRSDISHYPVTPTLPCPVERTMALARVATRLAALDALVQQRIINWGYALCDAALRAHVQHDLPAPTGFPYREAAV